MGAEKTKKSERMNVVLCKLRESERQLLKCNRDDGFLLLTSTNYRKKMWNKIKLSGKSRQLKTDEKELKLYIITRGLLLLYPINQ